MKKELFLNGIGKLNDMAFGFDIIIWIGDEKKSYLNGIEKLYDMAVGFDIFTMVSFFPRWTLLKIFDSFPDN